jgi:hypothetical protein
VPTPSSERGSELRHDASARAAACERRAPAPAPRSAAGTELLGGLWSAWSAPDPRAAVREVVGSAAAALAAGRGDEPATYTLLRGLEMLGERGPVAVGPAQHASLRDAATAQQDAFRASPRLATLRARTDGGVAAAQAALEVNPAYAPAQVALGRALLREGRATAARAVLEDVDAPERVQGAAVALARARAETGDFEKALLAAARETNAPGPYGVEPSILDPAIRGEVEEVRGLARLSLGALDAGARALLQATVNGSGRARRALALHAQRRDVKRALAGLARDASLSRQVRALAGILAR